MSNTKTWRLTTLGELCPQEDGIQTGPFGSQLHASEYTETGVPVIMPKDLDSGRVVEDTVARISYERASDLRRHKLQAGDIVFGRRGDIGRCALINDHEAGWICGTGCLRARFTSDVVPEFMIQYLSLPQVAGWLETNAVGQTMLNLNTAVLAELPINLPPLAEQLRIAKILGAWDEAIALTGRLIDALKRRKQGLMQRLLTGRVRFKEFEGSEWTEATLEDCCEILDSLRVPLNAQERSMRQGDIPYWGANGIVDYINDYIFDEPLILMAEDGGYFDEAETRPICQIVDGKCWVNNHAHVMRAKDGVLREWVYYWFVHRNIVPFINGGTRSKLNQEDLRTLPIMLPSYEEQKKVADLLTSCDVEIDKLSQYVSSLGSQKKGLMQRLLTGQIRVGV